MGLLKAAAGKARVMFAAMVALVQMPVKARPVLVRIENPFKGVRGPSKTRQDATERNLRVWAADNCGRGFFGPACDAPEGYFWKKDAGGWRWRLYRVPVLSHPMAGRL